MNGGPRLNTRRAAPCCWSRGTPGTSPVAPSNPMPSTGVRSKKMCCRAEVTSSAASTTVSPTITVEFRDEIHTLPPARRGRAGGGGRDAPFARGRADSRAGEDVGGAARASPGGREGQGGASGQAARGPQGGPHVMGAHIGSDVGRRLGIQGGRRGWILGGLQHRASIEAIRPARDRVAEAGVPGAATKRRGRCVLE